MSAAAFIKTWIHRNGTTSGTADTSQTISFGKRTVVVLIDNRSTTHNLLFSADGGTTFKTIDPSGSISLEWMDAHEVVIKSAGESQTYEILAGCLG